MNHRCLLDLWYNKPIDHDSGVAERKGLLNHRCLLDLWYNKPIGHDNGVAGRKGSLNRRCPSAAAAGLVAEKNSAGCILQRKT